LYKLLSVTKGKDFLLQQIFQAPGGCISFSEEHRNFQLEGCCL